MSARRSGVDLDAVTTLVERVAHDLVAPRFRTLGADDVSEKGPNDLVTVVDTEAEVEIARGLAQIAPDVPVVGEEAVAADATVLDRLRAPLCFVVDPIDGTQAFVDGLPDYAVMVGLVAGGVPVAGWVCLPETRETYTAVRGQGTRANGTPVPARPPAATSDLRGHLRPRTLPGGLRSRIEAAAPMLGARLAVGEGVYSGRAFGDLLRGRWDVVLFGRSSAWDHAPGVVLLEESGGLVRHVDGSVFRPTDAGEPLLVTRDRVTQDVVREAVGLPPAQD